MSKALNPEIKGDRYEQDFYAWTIEQARILRDIQPTWMDWKNVSEELESMGNRDHREVESLVSVILTNLMKLKWQPEKRTSGWQSTIIVQRKELAKVLEQSPSLKSVALNAVSGEWDDARRLAAVETGQSVSFFPDTPVWDPKKVLGDWWPDRACF